MTAPETAAAADLAPLVRGVRTALAEYRTARRLALKLERLTDGNGADLARPLLRSKQALAYLRLSHMLDLLEEFATIGGSLRDGWFRSVLVLVLRGAPWCSEFGGDPRRLLERAVSLKLRQVAAP